MIRSKSIFLSYLLPFFVVSTYLFLYIPIVILIIFSFNKSELPFIWEGFSFKWYQALWLSHDMWQSLINSLVVALSSVALSLTIGLFFIFYGVRTILARFFVMFYASLAMPEIVVAVGLLSVFSFFSIPLSFPTLIAGHTLIGLGYVVPILHSRFKELDMRYMEAAMDLGATEGQTLRWVIIPLLLPSLVAAALLVFILSFDDFLISFFCSGGSTQTLPIYIFVAIRSGATPIVNALSTVLLAISSLLVLLFSSLQIKKMDFLQ